MGNAVLIGKATSVCLNEENACLNEQNAFINIDILEISEVISYEKLIYDNIRFITASYNRANNTDDSFTFILQ